MALALDEHLKPSTVVIRMGFQLEQDHFVDLWGRPGDLQEGDSLIWEVKKDENWDEFRHEKDQELLARKKRTETDLTRRVIKHPNFHNFNTAQAEAYLRNGNLDTWGGSIPSSPSTYARPSGFSSLAPPPPGSLPARATRTRRELSPAGPEIDDIDHDGDARLRLSPLSLYRGFQLPLNAFFDEFHPSMADGEKLYRHHQIQHQGTEDAAQTRALESAPDDDDTTTSPEQ
ncbi:hypothetical protein CVT26_002855, partial [Gymnopilus dilepis]